MQSSYKYTQLLSRRRSRENRCFWITACQGINFTFTISITELSAFMKNLAAKL